MSKKECIQGFSDYIFWDVDRSSIDPVANAPYYASISRKPNRYSTIKSPKMVR
jgi:hypothetical protein